MSRDSQARKDSRTQRNTDNPRSGRQGEPSFSLNDKPAHNDQEEVIQIPKDKVGHVIGKKGWRKKDIVEQSGVQALVIKDDQVRLTGTEEQRTKAKMVINEIIRGEDSPDEGSWEKLDFIPEKYMGTVIGRNSENLNKIGQKTGATLKVWGRNGLYIKGSPENQKRAIREIKEQVNILIRRSQSGQQHQVRRVHVDTTHLDLNRKFELSVVQPPNDYSPEETKYYQLKQLKHSPRDMEDEQDGFTDINILRDELLMVLKNIHKEKEEETLKVVIWCHLGHAYIKEISEDDEKEDYFTLAEIKEKLEEKASWRTSIFEGGLDDIEIERIEEHLESHAVKEDIRYDFTFLTPSCRDVRVKAWLTEGAAKGEDETTSMAFSRTAPVRVKNILTRALPDGQGDSSNAPCFYLCSQYQRKMKVDILMVSKTFDYRLLIRTCKKELNGQDDFTGMEKLRDKLLMVLQNIQKEKEEEKVIVDIWCHVGHAYITKVDEADLEEEYFTLKEIKEKVEDQKLGWKSKFKGGLEKIEVEHIEESLESRAAKEEVRYDFTFYTPTCRYVRVKVWLTEKDGGEQEGDGATSMAFSRSAPFSVMSVMARAQTLPDEQGDSSHKPCFYMCSQTQQRLKADILMLTKECDYRLFTEVRDVHTAATKTDIHLHCEEWDQVLAEGNDWEPEQIVDKLPSFLQFLREVQINVTGGQ
ncbi:uncharacterized protein LOC110069397 [Orbicella faveolata]|uniref:uncharacterized protein LOC110069397 n=1 Tax=Orbicella faveolata TaxID=48498 RepID=UPI0009E4F0BE|nr:uncharacterized protein LOC110069397 [Orbicella faveolata]